MMPITNERIYAIDGSPVSPIELIDLARGMDEQFANAWVHQTSAAAEVLRSGGHEVTMADSVFENRQ